MALPALVYYPLRWIHEASSPPSPLWYAADRLQWIVLFSPLALMVMVWQAFGGFRPQ